MLFAIVQMHWITGFPLVVSSAGQLQAVDVEALWNFKFAARRSFSAFDALLPLEDMGVTGAEFGAVVDKAARLILSVWAHQRPVQTRGALLEHIGGSSPACVI